MRQQDQECYSCQRHVFVYYCAIICIFFSFFLFFLILVCISYNDVQSVHSCLMLLYCNYTAPV